VKLSGNTGLSRRFHAIMDAAEVSAPLAREKGKAIEGVKSAGREVRSLTFHSLRHTLTSLMHNAGVSRELRMQVTGHATEEAHEIYTHTELETLRGALATVPSL
jgi:integrase